MDEVVERIAGDADPVVRLTAARWRGDEYVFDASAERDALSVADDDVVAAGIDNDIASRIDVGVVAEPALQRIGTGRGISAIEGVIAVAAGQ